MSRAVGVHVGLSPELNIFCFFSHLMSHSLKQPIKNYSPGKRLEEHKQWCDYRQIFLALRFALVHTHLCITLEPTNLPVLQAIVIQARMPRGVLAGGVWQSFLLQTQKNTWAWNFTPKIIPGIKISCPKNKIQVAEKKFEWINYFLIHWLQQKFRSEVCKPEKIHIFFKDLKKYVTSFDPKRYRGCKFSTQKQS